MMRRMGGGNLPPRNVPVKVGDELDVKIEAEGAKGDGIAKKDGFVLFVPNTKEGDEVRIRVNKVLRRVGFAEVIGSSSESGEASKPEEVQDSESFGEEPAEEPASSDESKKPGEAESKSYDDFSEESSDSSEAPSEVGTPEGSETEEKQQDSESFGEELSEEKR